MTWQDFLNLFKSDPNMKQYRIKVLRHQLADNEKELYTGYIKRLEFELERAHDLNKQLLNAVLTKQPAVRQAESSEAMEPLRPTGMSMREAARRVREFEEQVLAKSSKDDINASEIESAVSSDASRAARGGSDKQGFAV